MRAGVHIRVAVAFLLPPISTLLEKGRRKRNLFAHGNGLEKAVSSVRLIYLHEMRELALENRELHKKNQRMSNHTSFGKCKSVFAALFLDFVILFNSCLYTTFLILIFLRTQSAINN
jgi:hypothetical protein